MSILILDDDIHQRLLLQRILQAAGYREVTALDTPEKLFLLLDPSQPTPLETPVDLILTDLFMPGHSGIEVCQRLKETESLSEIPVIVVTASEDSVHLENAFAAGAIDYLTKPVKAIELRARVQSALRLKREMDRRRNREEELHKRTEELERALRENKILSGLLPICSHCKKIRELGQWHAIETFISQNSEADFSHGICPQCMAIHYPWVKTTTPNT